ncbi:MAG: hypothetical protein ACD_46C00479G0001, partial [uncultured bacterium]
FIIAEAGVNHNGSLELAEKMVDVAVEAGTDAIKFQTFSADQLVTKTALKAEYQLNTTSIHESQYEMLKRLELSKEDHLHLYHYCAKRNIQFLSTPFDQKSVSFLIDTLQLPIIKISSGEITTAPLLLQIAKSDCNVILSTGMATLGDIETALGVLAFGYLYDKYNKPSNQSFLQAYCSEEGQKILKEKVTLLHCTSEYPVDFANINLSVLDTLKLAFHLPVGYSDHSKGIAVPIAAVAKGAVLIEKHFTLGRDMSGPDHLASLEPHELKNMVNAIREIELALGDSCKRPTALELSTQKIIRKSLVALCPIQNGELFSEKNLGIKRAGDGISSIHYWNFIQQPASRNYNVDELINE